MTKDEIQQRVDELQTWHYNHVLPFGISTGDSPIENMHPKLIQLLEGGAFARRIYPRVLDLGANSGLFSIWFCDNKQSHVTAIEGNDRYFEQLKFIIDIKGYEGRIQPVHQDLHITSYGSNEYDLVLLLATAPHHAPGMHLQ